MISEGQILIAFFAAAFITSILVFRLGKALY
uniref:Photosystem I protein M n=1 Tax=Sciadopitys verticillata TaxID=28979 RepID=A0A140H9B2_SCIVE|nr:photosystem I reaction center subunit M [Sciadopitys verticillata]AMO00734.1 photosystem I reaction center subunit M [Sciadopitys verticillata]BAW34596.1 photosystem I protein M [Sciadopitys verticillata]BCK60765.1 photosystem I subunit XII [Sciadopitys verticillata]